MSDKARKSDVEKLLGILEEFEHRDIVAALKRLGLGVRRPIPALLVVPPSTALTAEISRSCGTELAVDNTNDPPHDTSVYTRNDGDCDIEVRLKDGAGVTGSFLVPPGFQASVLVADVAKVQIGCKEGTCTDAKCKFSYHIGWPGGMTQIDPPSIVINPGLADPSIDSVVADLSGIVVLA